MNSESTRRQDLVPLEESLGYQFGNSALLETALQHSSYAHEVKAAESNERLEFLGDAVIGLVVAHLLFEAHPDWDEGELTRGLHQLVDRRALANLSRRLDIGAHLRLGRTEQRSSGSEKASILSDAAEAVFGAMYLDGGIAPVADLARRVFAAALSPGARPVQRDPKTRLQEWVMSKFGVFPSYECIADSGIEGDPERFTMQVSIEERSWGEGRAQSKRQAEQVAAGQALDDRDTIEQAHQRAQSEESKDVSE